MDLTKLAEMTDAQLKTYTISFERYYDCSL